MHFKYRIPLIVQHLTIYYNAGNKAYRKVGAGEGAVGSWGDTQITHKSIYSGQQIWFKY